MERDFVSAAIYGLPMSPNRLAAKKGIEEALVASSMPQAGRVKDGENLEKCSAIAFALVYVEVELVHKSNGGTVEYTYDNIGNPLNYMGKTMTWDYGRRLMSVLDGSNMINFAYDLNGNRIAKNNIRYYYSADGLLVSEAHSGYDINYIYGANRSLLGFKYRGQTYYYHYSPMGDVMAIYTSPTNVVARYHYGPWGELLSVTDGSRVDVSSDPTHIANINPIRYRGYYYDTETGFYYVSSRYYDPEIKRWISPEPNVDYGEFDEGAGLIGYNVYAYCANNPVNNFDPDGEAVSNIVGGIVGGVAGAALGVLLAKKLGLSGWKKWALISAATIGGAALGAFLGPYVAKLAKSVGSTVKHAAKNVVKYGKELCFVAGTKILTEDGKVPIEKIKVGDYVYAEDPETGEIALKRVAQVFVNETKELVHVVINGEEIITTPGHPFYVSGKGWVGADELACGDKVILYGGQCAYVDKVSIEHLITAVKVYNFEVEDFHTYFVGDNSVLVHNKGCGFKRYSDSQLAKIVKGKFHGPGGAKKAILKDVPKDILKRVGSNPDIAISKDGVIQLVSRIHDGLSIITDLNIKWY